MELPMGAYTKLRRLRPKCSTLSYMNTYYADRMGPELRTEVERQLAEDLRHYGVQETGISFDWSDSCQEGHCTRYLNGDLESLSSILVRNNDGENIAEGWMDFIHGSDENPLFVFWLFLDLIRKDGTRLDVKEDGSIPAHIWSLLPVRAKDLWTYDAKWSKDPLVLQWKKQKDMQ